MLLEKFNPIIPARDDGFSAEQAGSWTLRKNQIIHQYLQVFTSTMRRKFNYLVFLDLFSGSGLKRIGNSQYTYGSPVLAMDDSNGFSKFIFCEQNSGNADALRVRVNKYFRHKNVVVFNGNPNTKIDRLEYYIPDSSTRHKVSTICLIDPFSMDIEFETVKALADLGVNFLIIISLPWTKKDYFKICINEERELLNSFLGIPWSKVNDDDHFDSDKVFFRTLVKRYHQQLQRLGYTSEGTFHKMDEANLSIPFFFTGYYSNTRGTRKVNSEALMKVVNQVKLFE
jgi:three-Cys-motif partner protein